MELEFESVRLADLTPNLAYDLLTATVAPRPIAFITSVDSSGNPNLAAFSFFTLGGANPGSIAFSAILNADGSQKQTLKNIQEHGEFVANTAHREMVQGMKNSTVSGSGMNSKWEMSGFTQIPSITVAPPRIAESLVQFECKVFQIVSHGSGPAAARYVIGEVLMAHVARDLFREGQISGEDMHSIARLGGRTYVDTGTLELFPVD